MNDLCQRKHEITDKCSCWLLVTDGTEQRKAHISKARVWFSVWYFLYRDPSIYVCLLSPNQSKDTHGWWPAHSPFRKTNKDSNNILNGGYKFFNQIAIYYIYYINIILQT